MYVFSSLTPFIYRPSVAFLLAFQIVWGTSCGSKFGNPVIEEPAKAPSASTRISGDAVDTAEPAIAAAPGGAFVVAYITHAPDKSSDLFLSKFDAELKQSGATVRINENPGEVKTWYGDPPTIAAAGDGTIYVGWTRRVQAGGAAGSDLVLSVSHDGGQSFDKPVKVNDDKVPAAHGMHSLAVDGDRVYMSWLDERNVKMEKAELEEISPSAVQGSEVKAHHNPKKIAASDEAAEPNSEVFFASSSDGGKTFSKNIRVATDVCPCCKTSTLAAGDKLYLSWRQVLPGNFRHIAVASSGDGGKSFSNGAIVSDDKWMLSACPVSGAALATNDAGELFAYWYTAGAAGEPGLYSARSTDGGRTFGPRTLVDAQAVSGTPVLIKTSKGTACVFASSDQQTAITGDGAPFATRKYANAELPAAAAFGDNVVVAFVRKEGSGRSVWLTR